MKKNSKWIVCFVAVLICCAMIVSVSSAEAVEEHLAAMLKQVNAPVEEWNSSDDTREIFAALMLIEYITVYGTDETKWGECFEWAGNGMNEGAIYVYAHDETMNSVMFYRGKSLEFHYTPETGMSSYLFDTIDDDSVDYDVMMAEKAKATNVSSYTKLDGLRVQNAFFTFFNQLMGMAK